MKKLIPILITIIGFCFGQTVKVIKTEQILSKQDQPFAYPKFSPQGDKILLSSPKYKGLWLYEIDNQNIKQLNDRTGAGYKAKFSSDGSQILFRYNSYQNHRKFSTLAIQHIDSKKVSELVKNKRDLSPPHSFAKKSILFNLQNKNQVYDLEAKMIQSQTALNKSVSSEPVVYTENSQLIISRNGQEKVLNPAGKGHYIWGSLSPDKSRILFTVAGKGTYISDLEGKIIADLGHANYPNWSPDGRWIVGVQDRDDGHKITHSEIIIVSADGQTKHQLTNTENKIELNPDWSPVENKIVYDTIDGKIEMLQLSINE